VNEAAGIAYRPWGGALELFEAREAEALLAGPSGTGKSRAALEKLHFMALKYPALQALILRKTKESLAHSGLITFEKCVMARTPRAARWYAKAGEWRYENGSRLVCGGMDRVGKIMSSEYDIIYVQEATELSEDEWEHLTTRLRGQAAGFNQMIACANPAGPSHWLKKRAAAGRLKLIESRHEDNPLLWDAQAGSYTPFGATYLAKLDALTGVRHQRLRKGLWVAAEGAVYDEFDWNLHVRAARDAFAGAARPPRSWRRFWAVDFGYTQPFVWQAWAEDPQSKTLYRFAELYHTGLLVEEAAGMILTWMGRTGEDFPSAIICDHDAEDRATLRKKLGVPTVAAKKSVSPGIQAVKTRLISQVRGEGKGLVLLSGCGLATDEKLLDAKLPSATEEEVECYVWRDGVKDSEPLKANDHGLDAMRYLVMHVDGRHQWTINEIRAYGGLPPIAAGDAEGTAEQFMDREAERPSAEEWHARWLAEVERLQGERLKALHRGGAGWIPPGSGWGW
jgi:phage terminase large subunit